VGVWLLPILVEVLLVAALFGVFFAFRDQVKVDRNPKRPWRKD
jgi:hypothetical protein